MFVVVASWLSCVGLVTNNAVIIVASMLVSPLMGPIIAFTFGSYVTEMTLVSKGLVSEFIGLLIAVFVGYLGGLCCVPVMGGSLPTDQMYQRGDGWAAIYM